MVELLPQIEQVVLGQHGPVGPGRAVEPDPVADPLDHAGHRLVVGTGAQEAAPGHRELVSGAPALGQATIELGEHRRLQVGPGAEGVEPHPVGHPTRRSQHAGPDGGQGDGRGRTVEGLGGEVRGHEGELVVLPLEVEGLPLGPGSPDGPDGLHVLLDAGSRGRPGHAEAPFVVAPDLGAEPELEASARCLLQIPAEVGHDHGAAGEGDGHPGGQFEAAGGHGGDAQGQERIVAVLGSRHPVVPVGLDPGRHLGHGGQVGVGQGGVDLHAEPSPDPPPEPAPGTTSANSGHCFHSGWGGS